MMGGFYVACKVIPEFTFVFFTWGDFTYIWSKFLRSLPIIIVICTTTRWDFMCDLWPHVKSPCVKYSTYDCMWADNIATTNFPHIRPLTSHKILPWIQSTPHLISHASSLNLKRKGVWWTCIQQVVCVEFNKQTCHSTLQTLHSGRCKCAIAKRSHEPKFKILILIGCNKILSEQLAPDSLSLETEGCGLRDYPSFSFCGCGYHDQVRAVL